jgi:glucokinase
VLGVDALVARNANAARVAELWSYPNASGDPVVFVTMGSGIGVAGGAAGELGHIVVDAHGPECRCGRRGCLETFVSTGAIREQYQQLKGVTPEGDFPLALVEGSPHGHSGQS